MRRLLQAGHGGSHFLASVDRRGASTFGDFSSNEFMPRNVDPFEKSQGYHQAPVVTDRFRSICDTYGYDGRRDGNSPYNPEKSRAQAGELLSMTGMQHDIGKLDRVGKACDAAMRKVPTDALWSEVYQSLRLGQMCAELIPLKTDTYPAGHPRWVDLNDCLVPRTPCFLQLSDGLVVLPIFTLEEYMYGFFMVHDRWESVASPVPRGGSQWDAFVSMPFPVLGFGPLRKMNGLATMAVPDLQVGILLDPLKPWSKFISYPEMLYLAKSKSEQDPVNFHHGLMKCFDTVKARQDMKVLTPDEARAVVQRDTRGIPQIALLELQLLVFHFACVDQVTIGTRDRPAWKRLLSGSDSAKFTLFTVTVPKGAAPDADTKAAVSAALRSWSFAAEGYPAEAEVAFTDAAAAAATAPPVAGEVVLYRAAEGELLRRCAVAQGTMNFREELNFDEPLEPYVTPMPPNLRPKGKKV